MNNMESLLKPFEFDSPVEFVLIGVVGNKRAVVAKSKGAQVDLVAYAQRENIRDEDRPFRSLLFIFPFIAPFQLEPLAVDSQPADFPSNYPYDRRATECTLVWRGFGYARHKKKIKKEFQIRIADIVEAIEQQSASQLEWTLSPVIDQCHKATTYSKGKKLRFLYAFWFTMLVYLVGIAAFFVVRLV